MNMVRFHTDGRFDVIPLIVSAERRQELQSHMLLFFTRFSRTAEAIASKKIENLHARGSQLNRMRQMAEHAAVILQNPSRPLAEIGAMLHESWRLKRELADCVSTSVIDDMYSAAFRAGALGGKLLGAGGGGFMLVFAEPHSHGRIREALQNLIEVEFEIGSPGSRIVIYEPNGFGAGSRRNRHASSA
jgi:D-glycero-alpha-D-manno-heptose-7-phosphate kinase